MKTFFKIFFLAGFTAGITNHSIAQRGGGQRETGSTSRGNGGGFSQSSRSGGGNFSQPARSGGSFSQPRISSESRNNSYAASQRGERFQPSQRVTSERSMSQRSVVTRNNVGARNDSRPYNNSRSNINRVTGTPYNRNSGISARYNSYTINNYHYNSRYYGGGYYSYNNRRYSFMYGPRYTFIPRNSIYINFGGYPYYYNDGFYYGYYSGFYQPIFPPIGLRIGILPYGYSRFYLGSDPYYYYNGIYYRQYDDNNYEVVDAPMGATVRNLPSGVKSVTINGEKMYELNGTYYKEGVNSKGKVIYTVVGKNGEINNTEDNDIDNTNTSADPAPDNSNNVNDNSTSLQMGDILNQLPDGSKPVTIQGEKMYVTPDNTYLKENSDNGNTEYKVVGK